MVVKNKTSERDKERLSLIPPEDELFELKDNKLILGNGKDNLNLTILKPKTDKRAGAKDISLSQMIQTRVGVPEAQDVIRKIFEKPGDLKSKRVHLRVEIFDVNTNVLLCQEKSPAILDISSPSLAPPDIKEVKPKVSCQHGGREILIVTVHPIKNVVPKFQLWERDGEQILDDLIVNLLIQPEPTPDKDQRMIKFIAPGQPHLKELIENTNRVIKLTLQSTTENGLESTDPVEFNYHLENAFVLDGVCFMCQHSLLDGEPGGQSSLPPKTAPGAKRRRLSTRNSPPKGSQIYADLDIELLQTQAQEGDQNIFNVMVDVAPQINDFKLSQTSPSEKMEQEWSLNTPEMEEHVDSPEACEEEPSGMRNKLLLHIDRIETQDTNSSLNTPEVPTLGEAERQFTFPGALPPEDIFQTDGANPRMTLRQAMTEGAGKIEKPTENVQDFLVRCLFGNDKEAVEIFSSRRRGRGNYGLMEKLSVFFKHFPNFPTLLVGVLAMFIFFPITFQLVGLIFLAICISLCVTVYQNVTK